ncbi:MAG: glycosyltransferase [Deltaproteobacteria bacterium]|nr:glycosyltransferase [Deltaproteobacteria bacterium]
MQTNPLTILQVSTFDIGGGAEKIASDLFKAYGALGLDSWLVVGRKYTRDARVCEIPREQHKVPWAMLCWLLHGRFATLEQRFVWAARVCRWLRTLAQGVPEVQRELGWEDFHFPGTRKLLQLTPKTPDILHCHNLHGGYFDLRMLPTLSRRLPTVLTLHDEWLLSGHCAHSLACDRWREGCGRCPDVSVYPMIRRDASAFNWRRKRKIYARCRLYAATPSRWLMNRIEQSMLAECIVEKCVIPNGVDLSLFQPQDGKAARDRLNLPQDACIVLFVANRVRKNVFKDFEAVCRAVGIASQKRRHKSFLLLALGEEAPDERAGDALIRFIPYHDDAATVALYYQAADLYLHAAKADTFPTTILEALACATPVVATAVGGIPEQVKHGETGFLAPFGDAEALADSIVRITQDPELRAAMSAAARKDAELRFDFAQTASAYLAWYSELTRSWRTQNSFPRPQRS